MCNALHSLPLNDTYFFHKSIFPPQGKMCICTLSPRLCSFMYIYYHLRDVVPALRRINLFHFLFLSHSPSHACFTFLFLPIIIQKDGPYLIFPILHVISTSGRTITELKLSPLH